MVEIIVSTFSLLISFIALWLAYRANSRQQLIDRQDLLMRLLAEISSLEGAWSSAYGEMTFPRDAVDELANKGGEVTQLREWIRQIMGFFDSARAKVEETRTIILPALEKAEISRAQALELIAQLEAMNQTMDGTSETIRRKLEPFNEIIQRLPTKRNARS